MLLVISCLLILLVFVNIQSAVTGKSIFTVIRDIVDKPAIEIVPTDNNEQITTNWTNSTCNDTDGGINLFQEGQCYENAVYMGKDQCLTGGSLQRNIFEKYCNSQNHCAVSSTLCPEGYACMYGKCIINQTNQSNNTVTYQGVLNMLQNCHMYAYEHVGINNSTGLTTGARVCEYHGSTCTIAEIFYEASPGYYVSSLTTCNIWNDPDVLRVVCCSAPTGTSTTEAVWGDCNACLRVCSSDWCLGHDCKASTDCTKEEY